MLHGVVFHDGIRTPFLPLRALLCLCKCSVIAFTCHTCVLHVLCVCFDQKPTDEAAKRKKTDAPTPDDPPPPPSTTTTTATNKTDSSEEKGDDTFVASSEEEDKVFICLCCFVFNKYMLMFAMFLYVNRD